jgi:hypothetical protein
MHALNLKGNENCEYKGENEFSNTTMCYVALPSNCTDLINSSLYLGFQMSSEACGKLSNSIEELEECINVDFIFLKIILIYVMYILILNF